MQDLFSQALGINSPWFIKDIDFKKGSKFINNSDAAAKAYTAYDTRMKKYRQS